jgi:hypothetical protein
MCYRQYDGYSGTLVDVHRDSHINTGKPKGGVAGIGVCPDGHEGGGDGRCYKPCPSGSHRVGVSCFADTVYVGGPHMPGVKSTCSHYDLGTCWWWTTETECWGMNTIGGMCYPQCPAGTNHMDGAPYACKGNAPLWGGTGIESVGLVCPAGTSELTPGICSASCPAGYEEDPSENLGTCKRQCPAGTTATAGTCIRESYSRGTGEVPLVARMRQRIQV